MITFRSIELYAETFRYPCEKMVHGCGNRTVKFLFFTANLLICLLGALIFSFSLWANLDKNFAPKLERTEIHMEDFNILTKVSVYLNFFKI